MLPASLTEIRTCILMQETTRGENGGVDKEGGGMTSVDTSVTLPTSATNIALWAFSGCRSLAPVDIPTPVTSRNGVLSQDAGR